MSAVLAHSQIPGISSPCFDDHGEASAFGEPHDIAVDFRRRDARHAGAEAITIRYGRYDSEILGTFMMAIADHAVCRLVPGDDIGVFRDDIRARWPEAQLTEGQAACVDAAARIDAYWAGKTDRLGDMPLYLEGTAFQLSVWHALMQIPMDACVSYAAIARAVGAPGAARAVGAAVAANPVALLVPCHRVVKSGGAPGGYAWGRERKRQLLDLEAHVTAGPMQAV